MNFFSAQDQARKRTRWLIFWFVLASVSLILITNICVAWFVWYSNPANYFSPNTLPWHSSVVHTFTEMFRRLGVDKILAISSLVSGFIGLAMYFKWSSLKSGGRVVAESLGGRMLSADGASLLEQRLLNVVEEMALASAVPVPPVYILAHEQGINAFAAGLSMDDAVIGVTQGTIDYLDRDQLQGVIAHEFSHILNGDMALNTKVVAVLHGLMMIGESGRTLMDVARPTEYSFRSRRSSSVHIGLYLFGVCLLIIGSLGQLSGALIKAAVCRQREYLADASAVQFTRNPHGIAGALRVIGGYTGHAYLNNHRAHELGHFFFSQAYVQRLGWLATHPPLADRILRVLPAWRGEFISPVKEVLNEPEVNKADSISPLDEAIPFISPFVGLNTQAVGREGKVLKGKTIGINEAEHLAAAPGSVSLVEKEDDAYQRLNQQVHDVFYAPVVVLAMLLSRDADERQKQLLEVSQYDSFWRHNLQSVFEDVASVGQDHHIELIDKAMPSLKALSRSQFKDLKRAMHLLIHADNKVELFEWCLYQMVIQYCGRHLGLISAPRAKYRRIDDLRSPFQVVLSLLIFQATNQTQEQKEAQFLAACQVAGIEPFTSMSEEKLVLNDFSHAVRMLAQAYPLLKPRFIKALIHAARFDGVVTSSERQIIMAFAAVIDCPLVDFES